MNMQLVIDGDGFGIALTGMAIVFSGLAGVSIFIAILPRFLAGIHALANPKPKPVTKTSAAPAAGAADQDYAIQAAIAYVIDAERERMMDDDIRVIDLPAPSSWSLSNKMRTFPNRVK